MSFLGRPSTPQSVKLQALSDFLGVGLPSNCEDVAVTGVMHDSRRVRPGDLYLGLPGRRVHGARFAPEAARRGAAVLVSDHVHPALPTLAVADPRAAAGPLSSLVYGYPSEQLAVVGVTGTNGKTTTGFLVEHLLQSAGRQPGRVTTIDVGVSGRYAPSSHTTPEAPDLQAALACMVEHGCDSAVVEVSSHALALGRVEATRFAVGVFTNLSRDHLDFHGNVDRYLQCKATLFQDQRCEAAVINLDDPAGDRIAALASCPVTTVSARGRSDADWRVTDCRPGPWSARLAIAGPAGRFAVDIPMPGAHNSANTLVALAAADLLGVPVTATAGSLRHFPGVPGRLERIDAGQPFLAVVDFAHNPASLAATITALRSRVNGQIILVFGAPGDRDRGKRPLMRAAAACADVVMVTTDDPYGEDPDAIIADVMAGASGVAEGAVPVVEPARGAAIRRAVAIARRGDAVVIAGRGHETVQTIGDVAVLFDDRVELRNAILSSLP
jgi:UDP-N-acetylmuramoyl-L-alanyl-D-glutamate--2,6-diaminopimelate ligase